MQPFEHLGLSQDILDAVSLLGYDQPTPVQEQAIPAVLEGKDIVAGAKTGTGKTAAFALPLMNQFKPGRKGRGPRMLVITPTRELAQQICSICETIAACTNHRVYCVVGGVSYNPQIQKLASGVDILIATPGRLLDLLHDNHVNLKGVRYFVLDEADRMLDMGFAPDMYKIANELPEERQTLLFSATIDKAVEDSIGKLLHNPAMIEIAKRGEVADAVDQHIIRIPHTLKPALLTSLLRERGSFRVIVFARTRGRADTCARRLNREGIPAAAIHSDRSQNQRQRALADFDLGKIDVIVATDVLARGIDVENVSYVVNYDLPMVPEDYIHRIGRTGRAGATGAAISFVSPENEKTLKEIQHLIKQEIPEMTVASFDRAIAEEKVALQAMRAVDKRDPEIAAAVKEMKAREKRKEKARVRAEEEQKAAEKTGKKKPSAQKQKPKSNSRKPSSVRPQPKKHQGSSGKKQGRKK